MNYKKRFVFFGVWLLVCGYLFYVVYAGSKEKAMDELRSRQMIHARQAAAGIEGLIHHWMDFLAAAAKEKCIVELDAEGKRKLDFILRCHKDDISSISRLGKEGRILYNTPFLETLLGASLANRPHIRKMMETQSPTVSDVTMTLRGYKAIAIHYPVFKNNQFDGSIGILLDFKLISKRFLEVIQIGETGYAWMISASGIELYCPVPGHVGKSVFENCKDFPSIIDMAEKMVQGEQGVTIYQFDKIKNQQVETITKHAVYAPIQIGDTFWSIVVASSEEEVLASLQNFRNKLLALMAILFFGSVALAYFFIRDWALLREASKRQQAEEALQKSENRYRILFEEAPISLWEQDFSEVKQRLDALLGQGVADLRAHFKAHPEQVEELAASVQIIDVNKATLKLYKAKNKSELFKGLPAVFSQESYDDFLTCLIGIAKGETFFYFEKIHKTLCGDPLNVQLYWMAAPECEDAYERVIVSVIDITDLKNTTRALKESEQKYRSMMEAMREPVYICSKDYIVEYVNPAMIRRIGRDAAGESCYVALHDNAAPCSWCAHDRVMAGESIEKEIISPKDNHHYHVSSTPIFHANGTASQMTIYQDITDYIRAVHMKETAENQLRQSQKMEAIGTLAGGIAHDFNNILFPIIGYSEMTLEMLPPDDENRKNIKAILTSANRAKDLVRHILAFSRKSEKEMKPLLVQPIVKESLKLLRSTIPTSIRIEQNVEDTEAVFADPTQIHQILMNLCTNAYHAMEQGDGLLQVEVKETKISLDKAQTFPDAKPGRYVTISVKDTGTGMNPATLERIFEPYYTTKDKDKGTGLGLSVVHGIVKEHNGFILVESEVGKGSEFKVFLPMLKIKKNKAADMEDIEPPRGSESVLVVDDDEYIADMARQMLVRLGYKATMRYSSLDALELFRNKPHEFDIVVTDMAMPNMTGDRLARELKKIRPDIPVVICTGYSEKIDSDKANELGFSGFLMKPILLKDLAIAVRKALD